jgi:hypothetical protein
MSDDNLETIPAGHGRAVRLPAGAAIEIVNVTGTQVIDTWAFVEGEGGEYMSLPHTRVETGRMVPRPGEMFLTNRREDILRMEEDTSPGIHDTIMAACDAARYARLGCAGYHRNCADNMNEALAALGLPARECPQPLNLFMNIPVHPDRTLEQGAPVGQPGEFVRLRALRDCVVVMSACPQDMTPINGADRVPQDGHYRVSPKG